MRLAQHLPRTIEQLPAAEAFCNEYGIDLDKFIAEAVEADVRNTLEDESNMAHHLRHNRVKTKKAHVFSAPQCEGVAALINEAAKLNGKLTITVSFPITPEAFRVLLAGAAESGAPLEELVGTAVNRLVTSKPVFTIPRLRNS